MDSATEETAPLDTDVLLAMLISLLDEPVPPESELIDALVAADGNVQHAAARLRSTPSMQNRKRKRTANLHEWLRSPASSKSARLDSAQDGPNVGTSVATSARGGSPNLSPPSTSSVPSLSTLSNTRDSFPAQETPRRQPASLPAPTSQHRPLKSAFALLRAPSPTKSTKPTIPRPAPLTLTNPDMVAQHTPCTMHLNILPPELACQLFHAMVRESDSWLRNKWYLFDREVESPHKTSFFVRMQDRVEGDKSYEEAARMWYNGRPNPPPKDFLPEMELACEIIERVVSEQFTLRQRYPLEWGGKRADGQLWRANFAASNCYTGRQESVGFHSDQLTYLGPYATIASLSLGTTRLFRLREVVPKEEASTRHAQTFNMPLSHNSLTIMHATCQEYFKHCVPPQPALDVFRPPFPAEPGQPNDPSNIRINLTFRFYRPDFHPSSIPRCKCNVPMILRPDMKGRPKRGEEQRREIKYWWTCYAGAQNEGKGCNLWQVMDARAEGRGPFVGDLEVPPSASS